MKLDNERRKIMETRVCHAAFILCIQSNLQRAIYAILLCTSIALSQTLRVISVNCWSGLDYRGTFRMGEYETADRREKRFQLLVHELKKQNADIIALQEVNPIAGRAARLADSLGYDYICQRANAGLKIGSVGIPINLNEGLVILARKELHLKFVDIWRLSSRFGAIGNTVSLHFSDMNIALVSRVSINGHLLFVVNCHLSAAVPRDSLSISKLREILLKQASTSPDKRKYEESFMEQSKERERQIEHLIEKINELPRQYPVILMGDFNAAPSSRELSMLSKECNFLDIFAVTRHDSLMTWDPEHNSNITFSRDTSGFSEKGDDFFNLLDAWYDGIPRRIDYILPNSKFQKTDVQSAGIFLNEPRDSVFSSDHYGIYTILDVANAIREGEQIREGQIVFARPEIEPLPIVSYDSDVGFGYGAKAFFLNQLGWNESFDIVAFNSTKGERWYRFVFSLPDFEIRQGKVYPWAVDVVIDYDKWIRNNFFGVGNGSRFEDREYYTREPFEISFIVNRGFTSRTVGQLGVKYKSVRNFNFESTSRLIHLSPSLNSSVAKYGSLFMNYRYDSRDSYINPSNGVVLQSEVEYTPNVSLSNVNLLRASGWFQYYTVLFYPKTVFAFRTGLTDIYGTDLPVQMLQSIGGNLTLRGFPQDRYLDKASALVNTEIRFPIFWRFGGIAGFDAGKVWSGLSKMSLYNWLWNSVIGLRLYMDTFVVRMDIGFSGETTGFYLNFGQLF